MFSKYYQNELSYLREMGRDFGLSNPAIAGLLSERGADPDVERLLEGFCFLTARIRERLDAGVPEIVHGLTDLLVPQYLRPIPAASIVEFTPHARVLRSRTRIPRGSEVASTPLDGTSCRFRTTSDVDLLPLSLTDVVLDQSSALRPVLRVALQTSEQGRAEVFQPEGIRFYLHGELPLTATVLLWLLRHCQAVTLREEGPNGRKVSLSPASLHASGFSPEHALLPWPKRANDGYRLLVEYFTLPQKLLFVDVRGLDRAAGLSGEKFELVFELERPPPLPSRIGKDLFKLHCAPVVNLFSTPGDPMALRIPGEEHLVRAAGLDPAHMEVFTVDQVVGVRAGRGERTTYRSFNEYAHAVGGAAGPGFFRLRRATSPVNDGLDAFLSLGAPGEARATVEDETLSVDLTCTNRSLPARLQLGDLQQATGSSPTTARFRNIVPVSKPARPPLGAELHWRLLSHLAVHQQSLADPATLRGLLALYNFQTGADHPAARANQLRIESIGQVSAAPVRRLLQGTPVRGFRTQVDVEEARFAGPGDAFLFGQVLDELLSSNVTLNAFNELALRLSPSQLEYTWAPRSGTQAIL